MPRKSAPTTRELRSLRSSLKYTELDNAAVRNQYCDYRCAYCVRRFGQITWAWRLGRGMYICVYLAYIDESGYVGHQPNAEQPVQVIACVLANAYNLHRTMTDLQGTIQFLRDRNIPLRELKAGDIYRGRHAWHGVGDERHQVLTQHFAWLAARGHKLILSVIENQKFFGARTNGNPVATLFEAPYVAGAIHVALSVQKRNQGQKKNKGKTVLIFDEQEAFEGRVEDLIGEPPDFTNTFYGYEGEGERLSQIVDTAFFAKSHFASLIQVADTVAFVASLYLRLVQYGGQEAYAGELQRITGWTNMLRQHLVPLAQVYPQRHSAITDFYRNMAPDNLHLLSPD